MPNNNLQQHRIVQIILLFWFAHRYIKLWQKSVVLAADKIFQDADRAEQENIQSLLTKTVSELDQVKNDRDSYMKDFQECFGNLTIERNRRIQMEDGLSSVRFRELKEHHEIDLEDKQREINRHRHTITQQKETIQQHQVEKDDIAANAKTSWEERQAAKIDALRANGLLNKAKDTVARQANQIEGLKRLLKDSRGRRQWCGKVLASPTAHEFSRDIRRSANLRHRPAEVIETIKSQSANATTRQPGHTARHKDAAEVVSETANPSLPNAPGTSAAPIEIDDQEKAPEKEHRNPQTTDSNSVQTPTAGSSYANPSWKSGAQVDRILYDAAPTGGTQNEGFPPSSASTKRNGKGRTMGEDIKDSESQPVKSSDPKVKRMPKQAQSNRTSPRQPSSLEGETSRHTDFSGLFPNRMASSRQNATNMVRGTLKEQTSIEGRGDGKEEAQNVVVPEPAQTITEETVPGAASVPLPPSPSLEANPNNSNSQDAKEQDVPKQGSIETALEQIVPQPNPRPLTESFPPGNNPSTSDGQDAKTQYMFEPQGSRAERSATTSSLAPPLQFDFSHLTSTFNREAAGEQHVPRPQSTNAGLSITNSAPTSTSKFSFPSNVTFNFSSRVAEEPSRARSQVTNVQSPFRFDLSHVKPQTSVAVNQGTAGGASVPPMVNFEDTSKPLNAATGLVSGSAPAPGPPPEVDEEMEDEDAAWSKIMEDSDDVDDSQVMEYEQAKQKTGEIHDDELLGGPEEGNGAQDAADSNLDANMAGTDELNDDDLYAEPRVDGDWAERLAPLRAFNAGHNVATNGNDQGSGDGGNNGGHQDTDMGGEKGEDKGYFQDDYPPTMDEIQAGNAASSNAAPLGAAEWTIPGLGTSSYLPSLPSPDLPSGGRSNVGFSNNLADSLDNAPTPPNPLVPEQQNGQQFNPWSPNPFSSTAPSGNLGLSQPAQTSSPFGTFSNPFTATAPLGAPGTSSISQSSNSGFDSPPTFKISNEQNFSQSPFDVAPGEGPYFHTPRGPQRITSNPFTPSPLSRTSPSASQAGPSRQTIPRLHPPSNQPNALCGTINPAWLSNDSGASNASTPFGTINPALFEKPLPILNNPDPAANASSAPGTLNSAPTAAPLLSPLSPTSSLSSPPSTISQHGTPPSHSASPEPANPTSTRTIVENTADRTARGGTSFLRRKSMSVYQPIQFLL